MNLLKVKRVSKVIVLIAVALSVGLHWVVLQSVAWAGMFAELSSQYPMAEAVARTFDAENKCAICLLVEEGTRDPSDPESVFIVKLTKLDGCPAGSGPVIGPPAVRTVALMPPGSLHPEIPFPPGAPPPRG